MESKNKQPTNYTHLERPEECAPLQMLPLHLSETMQRLIDQDKRGEFCLRYYRGGMGPFDDGGIDERMLDYFIRGSDIHSLRTVLCVTYARVRCVLGTQA